MAQRKLPDQRQGSDIAIDRRAHAKQAGRYQLTPFSLDHIEIRQAQYIADIGGAEEVHLRLGHFQARCLPRAQDRLPQMAVIGNDDAGFLITQVVYLLQHRLTVIHKAQRIGQQDEIIGTGKLPAQAAQLFYIADAELQFRIFMFGIGAACDINHIGGKIHAHTKGWFQPRQLRAGPTAQIQNARPFRNQESQEGHVIVIETGILGAPIIPLGGHLLVIFQNGGLSGR